MATSGDTAARPASAIKTPPRPRIRGTLTIRTVTPAEAFAAAAGKAVRHA